MHRFLVLACRAFPRDHRARRSDEVVDTALLAANGSKWCAAREAFSLLAAGWRERLRAEPRRSLRDGLVLLAGLLALVNLAVALAGIALCVQRPVVYWLGQAGSFFRNPYVIDWWWIAFAVAAAGLVLGLVLGDRRLALSAALVNLGVIGYDAIFLTDGSHGHMRVFAFLPALGFPGGWTWLPVAAVLALATAAAPLRRLPLSRLPLALAASVLLVVISREAAGSSFFFLRWPLAAIVVLAMACGWRGPRLAVLGIGVSLAAAPSVVGYLSVSYAHHDPVVKWVAAPGLALGVVLPLAYLTRRRLA
jgi:hypothetical protein